jgi:23S rRNA pseudouridine2457 synthase
MKRTKTQNRRASTTLILHKPYGVLSRFTPEPGSRWKTLAEFIPVPDVYAAGRLDADSEGFLLLTSDAALQRRLTDPRHGHWRRYLVQVEGLPSPEALGSLADGLVIQGRRTRPARVRAIAAPEVPERIPPIRFRRSIPTSWLELELREGRNRQVRRMTAAVGLPTLRLIRSGIDLLDGGPPLELGGLAPGQWRGLSGGERRRLESVAAGRPRPAPVPVRLSRARR